MESSRSSAAARQRLAPPARQLQDGVSPQAKWLKKVSNDRGMSLAVYAEVQTGGEFAVGEHAYVGPSLGQQ
jgi:hypothetical protein